MRGRLAIIWRVDDDPSFSSLILGVDTDGTSYQPTSPFADGTFYFRVQATNLAGGEGAYSTTGEITFIDCSATTTSGLAEINEVLLNVAPILQHKDTRMLVLDGDPETGTGRWDSAHEDDGDWIVGNGTPFIATPLDRWYCTRASISMIVAYLGGNLSQDRIAYYAFGGGWPEADFGYGIGLGPNQLTTFGHGKNPLDWALNGATAISSRGKPT